MRLRASPCSCKPLLALAATLTPEQALAHASNQSFVLLLPTDIYIAAGVATVALTILLVALVPGRAALALFRPLPLPLPRGRMLRAVALWLSFVLLVGLIWSGLQGPRDPLVNPLPLTVWTVWWIGLVTLQGVGIPLWSWLNPWWLPAVALRRFLGLSPRLRLPRQVGRWPAVVAFLLFAALLLADPAPADPTRLARIVASYSAIAILGATVFGPRWFLRVEAITVLMRAYGRLAPLGCGGVGIWGWRLLRGPVPSISAAIFLILILGTGSFDGLNETFWWLSTIGVNPLEFPGRSAVIAQTLAGLLAANLGLLAAYSATLWLGLRLAGDEMAPGFAMCAFAPSLLPIALGYHIAHYLPTALVEFQYVLVALSDPLGRGNDLLGLGQFYVTTGFFNTRDSTRAIWLSQAGAVVLGHVIAILLAHALALRHLELPARRAALMQAPLALFMVLYTLFGLWLLASPRG